jgi:dGTPase
MTMPRALAPYASRADRTRGRLHPEAESATRSPFQRDRDRIIHCTAFRRLEYKTQVFVNHEGDHYRTRLTHSLEVAQITRSICRALNLDDDLGEAVALAHDLGHTPFGHAGEEALDDAMAAYGGFDHNAQTLRILTRLEQRYAEFDGLNLTWEALEGVVKHNGPLQSVANGRPIPGAILDYVGEHDLEIASWCGPEAQVAALSDDIAYCNHDIDDGLRANLFDIADIAGVPIVSEVFDLVRRRYGDIERSRFINEAIRRLITRMVDDLIAETSRRLAALGPGSVDDVRHSDAAVVAFSDAMVDAVAVLRDFLFGRMYRHPVVNEMSANARRVVVDLFRFFMADPSALPDEWKARALGAEQIRRARLVADYIAGMTDRYALQRHTELKNS